MATSNKCWFYTWNGKKSGGKGNLKGKREMDRWPKTIPLKTALLQKYCLNYFLTARPGISFFLRRNSFPFHKRKQFPRNYYPSLFADKMLKSHSILHSPGWTQFSSSIRPPKLSLCENFPAHTHTKYQLLLPVAGEDPENMWWKDPNLCNWRKQRRHYENDRKSVVEGEYGNVRNDWTWVEMPSVVIICWCIQYL